MQALSRTDPALRSLHRRERITRLESERRALREAVQDTEGMLAELDAHLARVEQAKRDWLQSQHDAEAARRKLAGREASGRRALEAQAAEEVDHLYETFFIPELRRLRAAPVVPRHRR
jgi:chromosome segregation ATPase